MINRGTSNVVSSKMHQLKSRVCIVSILFVGWEIRIISARKSIKIG